MSKAQKFVKSLYPDAYLLETLSPVGNHRYQVVYDITGTFMPTWYWAKKNDAWKQAELRINQRLMEKLES